MALNSNQLERLKTFLLLLVPILVVLFVFSSTIFYLETSNEKKEKLSSEKAATIMAAQEINNAYNNIITDLNILKNSTHLNKYINKTEPNQIAHHIEEIEKRFINISQEKKIYDQIRFIDFSGQEIVRVNYEKNNAIGVKPSQLQNKQNRYYFNETMRLENGKFYISPIDLNIENGQIEEPHKPTVRIATPVLDKNNQKQGILVINYLVNNLFTTMIQHTHGSKSEIDILNNDGYWLMTNDPEKAWGFLFKDKIDINLQNLYPKVWEKINKKDADQVIINDYAYSFIKLNPYNYKTNGYNTLLNSFDGETNNISNNEYHYIIVSKLSKYILLEQSYQLLLILIIICSILLLIFSIGTWFLSKNIAQKKLAEKKALELNDLLRVINKILRHDLLNKLTGIKYSIELFQEIKQDDVLKVSLDSSISGIELIGKMKELELTVSSGSSLQPIDLKDVINKATKGYDIKFITKGTATVNADPAIYSVFNNIIGNAIKHGQTDRLTINITKRKNETIIKFIDYGVGIPKEIRHLVFKEGFKYGKNANSGIGLYIVKKTIERYGGTVNVKANHPKGTVFIIKLPKT